MRIQLNAIEKDGQASTAIFHPVPDVCPICHRSVSPKAGQAYVHSAKGWAQVVYQCTSDKCTQLFIGTYRYSHTPTYPLYELQGVQPIRAQIHEFPQSVAEVSPMFVEIYNDARAAEGQGLAQLVGIGLRKAVEFLIKDFSVHQHPDQTDRIKSMMLGPCINEYVTDQNVKDCAKRAAWLGNDETHYIRKWEDKDITDLKLLVRLTTNWVDNVLLTQKYVADMPWPGQ